MIYQNDDSSSDNYPDPNAVGGTSVLPLPLAQLLMAARAAQQTGQTAALHNGAPQDTAFVPSPAPRAFVLSPTDPFVGGTLGSGTAGLDAPASPADPDPAKAAAIQKLRQQASKTQASPQAAQTAQSQSGVWFASGDAKDPYKWVSQCSEGQTCYESVAAGAGKNVIVYGSNGAQDKKKYTANNNGMIDMRNLSDHHDSGFDVADGQAHPEEYLDVARATALFNVSVQYADAYPSDSPLVFTAGSTDTGEPGKDASGNYVHTSHRNGANIDMRYMGKNGKAPQGKHADDHSDLDP